MQLRICLGFSFLLVISISLAQFSVRKPLICHDENSYLKCLNSGNYILNFDRGAFVGFKTNNSQVFYSDSLKTVTIYREKPVFNWVKDSVQVTSQIDTLRIQLNFNSITFKNGDTSIEVNSLEQIPSLALIFNLGYSEIEGKLEKFSWLIGHQHWQIETSTWRKKWAWSIYASDSSERFFVKYNSWKNGGLEIIGIQNDSLKYGIGISTSFRSFKNIEHLYPTYIETISRPGIGNVITDAIIEKEYNYFYDKKGVLRRSKMPNQVAICRCD